MKKALKELAAVIAATCVSLWPVLVLAQEPSRRGGGIKYTSAGGGGSGDVVGPASSVDNAIARFSGTDGKTIQNYTSGAPTISDTGEVSVQMNGATYPIRLGQASDVTTSPLISLNNVVTSGGALGLIGVGAELYIQAPGSGVTIRNLSGSTTALTVNNSTSTGNIFEAKDNGTTVFTIADGGTTTLNAGLVVKSTGAGTPTIFEVPARTLITGTNNIIVGSSTTGDAITSATDNIAIGAGAGSALVTSGGNVMIGSGAGAATVGVEVVAIGTDALRDIAASYSTSNTAVGYAAGRSVTRGTGSTLIGAYANAVGSTAEQQTCVGYKTCGDGNNTESGSYSVAVGYEALNGPNAVTAEYNVALGYKAGSLAAGGEGNGDANIWLGPNAGATQSTLTSNCIAIGNAADCTASNATVIGSATGYQTDTTIIRSATGSADIQEANSEQITLSTGGTTTASSGNIVPANSIVDAIACRITTTITTATEWGVSITGDAAWNQIGTTDTTVGTLTAGTTAIFVAPAHDGQYNDTATTITITTTGTPGAGVVRCAVHSRTFTAPTS